MSKSGQNWGKIANYPPQCLTKICTTEPGNTVPFKSILQRWRAVDNTVSNLTGPRFEPQTFLSRNERITARPIDRLSLVEYRHRVYEEDCGLQYKQLVAQSIIFSNNDRV